MAGQKDPGGPEALEQILLQSAREGRMSRSGADRIFAAAYDELHLVAEREMRREKPGHTLQPTALLNEVYLKLFGPVRAEWEGRGQFLAIAVRAMRQVLIDHARRRAAEKRGGGLDRVSLHENIGLAESGEIGVLDLEEALARLAQRSERMARIVELRIFGDLTGQQIADILGVSRKTVQEDWRVATMWLRAELAGEDAL